MEVTLERLDEIDENEIVIETPDFSLAHPEFMIGRAQDCQLQIPSKFVSRHHCELIVDDRDHAVRIRDLGSQNGTFVNEAAVTDERELRRDAIMRMKMKRAILVLVVMVLTAGFVRGWFVMTGHREKDTRKIDVNLTVDPDQFKKDAAKVGESTLELKDEIKEKLKSESQKTDKPSTEAANQDSE